MVYRGGKTESGEFNRKQKTSSIRQYGLGARVNQSLDPLVSGITRIVPARSMIPAAIHVGKLV